MALVRDFIGLFFPRVCEACGNLLYQNEDILCTRCMYHLPKTNFHLHRENPVTESFWGRVPLESGASFLYYAKAGRVQNLIHRFKYNGKRDIGKLLGEMYGRELKKSPFFRDIQTVVPVPLHWTKKKKRGFNQSEIIGEAMAGAMEINMETRVLYRRFATETQTRKSRFRRSENVENKFDIQNGHLLRNRHVLLLDDVITTGSTMESCALALLQIPGLKLSVASIGFAGR